MDGDAATASPGFSAEASPFAAVLENWAPMLSYSTKKLNRSKRRGNKERWVGINTGRPAAVATHTHTRGEKKGEERTEPIIMHSFKKFKVEEIKKQQHRREGKKGRKKSSKKKKKKKGAQV